MKQEWFTTRQWCEAFSEEFPTMNVAHKLAARREVNGLEAMGACVKKEGRPLMWNRPAYERWLSTPTTSRTATAHHRL